MHPFILSRLLSIHCVPGTAWEHSSDKHSSAQKQQQTECSIGWEGAAMEKVKKKSGQVEGAQRGHQEEQKPWGGILRLC